MRVPLDELRREGQARIFDVLSALGVAWRRSNTNYISICNPVVKDNHPSFTIWTAGGYAGAFKDHRGCASGDLIDLVAYLKGWSAGNDKSGRKEAINWLAGFLGLWNLTDEERNRLASKRRVAANAAAARAARDLKIWQAKAAQTFFNARRLPGTPAETYLRARGIELELLPKGPKGGNLGADMPLRFLPADHPMAYHRESAKGLPCMVAACVDWHTGAVKAIHRTWLKPDGGGKAEVDPVKKVWPAFSGLVIPLWRGESNLRLADAIVAFERDLDPVPGETLMLTEGIEDALTSVLQEPQHRTWAFISLGNLRNVLIPSCVDRVILHQHYEPTNQTATAAFEAGRRAIWKQGELQVLVRQVRDPRRGKDFNAEWMSKRAEKQSPDYQRREAQLRKFQRGKT